MHNINFCLNLDYGTSDYTHRSQKAQAKKKIKTQICISFAINSRQRFHKFHCDAVCKHRDTYILHLYLYFFYSFDEFKWYDESKRKLYGKNMEFSNKWLTSLHATFLMCTGKNSGNSWLKLFEWFRVKVNFDVIQ